ncbi:MAG: hypothetical protein DI628_04355 [Blastochloris viridis]|uniref:Uncharacterized protein n=1 Tax=Blastochloris viridis TaxID=1079 RepID=A0A6N4RFD9_BLAVI|nr:MAG: hypothetical protein DI628_04355 [Blastochloris viridis]
MPRAKVTHDPDGPSEAQAHILMDMLQACGAIPFDGPTSLPVAFQKALGKGKAPPQNDDLEPVGNYDSRNAQLHRQQGVDKTNLARTMNQMGGQFGFRSKEK